MGAGADILEVGVIVPMAGIEEEISSLGVGAK